ncbi:MAG: hypothetical protein ABSE84_15230, partial [Isosphaeraceae bacterium]
GPESQPGLAQQVVRGVPTAQPSQTTAQSRAEARPFGGIRSIASPVYGTFAGVSKTSFNSEWR